MTHINDSARSRSQTHTTGGGTRHGRALNLDHSKYVRGHVATLPVLVIGGHGVVGGIEG